MQILKIFKKKIHPSSHPFASLGRTHWVVSQYCHLQLYYYVIIWGVVVKLGCDLMLFPSVYKHVSMTKIMQSHVLSIMCYR